MSALLLAEPAVRAEEANAQYEFDIPAQSLPDALRAFAQSSREQVVLDEAQVRGRNAPALVGRFTAAEGLSVLLTGSGLHFDRTSSGVWIITPAQPSRSARHLADFFGTLEEVVVTGTTSRNRTVRQSSVAVTVADRRALDRKAPRSTAQALELIPGIYVEASGGEVLNNFTARGLPGGGQTFVQLSEDGLPVFYTPWLADAVLKPDLSIERLESVRGGTSGVLTVQGAGATANFITRKATSRHEATARLTSSDFGTARADLWAGGPLLRDDWRFSVGGFYRASDGVRDPGYPADEGGALRATLDRTFDGGELGINVKITEDHNTFLTPIVLRNPRDPAGIPALDPLYGSQYSTDNAVQRVRVSPATGRTEQITDLRDGLHSKSTTVGYRLEQELLPQWRLRSKGRYIDFTNGFNALFSRGNETLVPATQRLDPAHAIDVRRTLERFSSRGAVTAALQVVSTGELIAGPALATLNGNGLTADMTLAGGSSARREFANDASVVWENERNSLTAGFLYFDVSGHGSSIGDATFISEVADNPRRMDIVALDADNRIVGYLTENGLLNYANGADSNVFYEARSRSVYLNDELRLTDRWRLDAGFRFEWYDDFVKEGITSSQPLPVQGAFDENGNDLDDIIANNYIGQFYGGHFTGAYRYLKNEVAESAWTAGLNHQLTERINLYGRYAKGFQTNGQARVTHVRFGELGLRYEAGALSASVTGFHTWFEHFLFSRIPPATAEAVQISGDFNVTGAEFDATWRPSRFFQLQLIGVVQDSRLHVNGIVPFSYQTQLPAGAEDFARTFDGNRPERTPEVTFTLMPTWLLPNGRGQIYVSYRYVGPIYADIANRFELPAFGIWNLGFTYDLTPRLQLNVNVDNLTNELALTEGNPRSGFDESAGVNDAFYARPAVGRNALISLTYDFSL